ncbi:HAE1 family hydrophobic/amphiphilic exporter-1 [Algoriphagus sp. 4150]|uniref:efflux RND transporter permease subunit n=1 Tax=Algoriphagus sp. 4150 TaxID=2817756 RepID=UPI00285DC538|nr:efflux RND transporter permease subunit [Algoriphagus sp. 4150]MDR7128033.1 HAE1 family hydrophobic/amphiphilic exporter-1 [Algoriphagus sp. 4150]
MSLTELSIKRPLLITTVFIGLILFGIIGYTNLNYNLLPSFSAGVVTINTVFPGASPSEVQSKLTKPIEEAISTVEGIDLVTSSSLLNVSSIQVNLKPDVSDILAQQDIERKINQIKSTLPEGVEEPAVNRVNTDNFAILNLSATANIADKELYELIDRDIKPKISGVKGVGQINIIGGQSKEIKIELDNTKLQMYQLSAKQVFQVVLANTISIPGGNITNEQENLSITIDAGYSGIDLLPQLIVKDKGNGSRVLLSDVATVSDGQEKVATLNRINGKPGIGIQIFKTNDANAVEVSREVKQKLAELVTAHKSVGFQFEIASDQSVYTLESANSVIHDLMLAVLIVGFVMLLFLHSLRSAFFVLIAIPAAMIPTFIVMYVLGFSLNLMTLLALSLVVGILVDDSIVVLENIFRHMEMGKNKEKAALEGRNEIGFTALAITLVDVVVFLPMALAGGLIGNLLREFATVVVVSTLMSLLVAFTLTPLMASRFARLEHLSAGSFWGRVILSFESYLNKLADAYGHLLHWILHRKRYFFILVILLLVGSISLVPAGFIGGSFAGQSDRGELAIQLETASDMPIRQTNLLVAEAEKMMLRHPEVKTVYSLLGTQTGAKGSAENLAELSVTLIDKKKRELTSDEFGLIARNEIEKIPGIQVTVIPTSITGTVISPIQISVKGKDPDSLFKAASIVRAIVAGTAGSDYVRFSTKGAVKQIQIIPDREKIAMLGLSLAEVTQSIQLAFNGNNKIEFGSGDNTYNVNVAINDADKRSMEAVRNLSVNGSGGKLVKLGQVADVKEVVGQSILQRTDRENSITITSAAVGRPSGTIVDDIQKELQSTRLPADTEISYQGDAKNQTNAFGSLGFALVIAIILVYMVLVCLYESVVYPFVVIFSVPVALIGALLAIALTMNELTVFTIIGIIMLLGLVTKNGILIVDFANQLKSGGKGTVEALILAGKERLRPIIMTTFSMILGMLPLALSQSPGSEFKNGMAWVLIGGLTSSFLLTLFLVPSVYLVVDTIQAKISRSKYKIGSSWQPTVPSLEDTNQ